MRTWVIRVIAGMLLLAAAAASRAQQPLSIEPREGLLLLTGGQVLCGKITRAGDHYYVTIGQGEIRLKATEVELFCRNLEEGYQSKRAAITSGEAQDYLDLADWCIRLNLYGYAAREISEAIQRDPNHPKIALVERRLEVALEQNDKTASAEHTPARISNDDLDRMVRGMPAGTIEAFTHSIQPLLLNHCSTAGCHGPGSATGLSLLRIPLGKTPSRRLTQRNLHATMRFIQAADPGQSPLLVNSIHEHGPLKSPIFTSHDMVQYKLLVAWVYRVAQKQAPEKPSTLATTSEPLMQAPLSTRTARTDEKAPAPSGSESAAATVKPADAEKSLPPAQQSPGASKIESSDPFDPEVFNRQYARP